MEELVDQMLTLSRLGWPARPTYLAKQHCCWFPVTGRTLYLTKSAVAACKGVVPTFIKQIELFDAIDLCDERRGAVQSRATATLPFAVKNQDGP